MKSTEINTSESITANFLRNLYRKDVTESLTCLGALQHSALLSTYRNEGRVKVRMNGTDYDVSPNKHEPAMLSLTPLVAGLFGHSLTWGSAAFSDALRAEQIVFI